MKNSFLENEIVLKTKSGDIFGSILTPDNDAKEVIALFICGSGPTDRNGNNMAMTNNSIKYLAEDLCKAGIGSVRYDKRGIAASQAAGPEEIDLRFDTYVDDAKEWVNFLSETYKKIILIGHSEGSLIAIMTAKNNPKVVAVVSLAGVGRPADEILKIQLQSQPRQMTDVIFPYLDKLKQGELIDNVPMEYYSLFRPSVQPYMISWLKIDPKNEIKELSVPIIIIQGDKDVQVSVDDALLLSQVQPNAKMVIIPNMNHVLKECDSSDMNIQKVTYINPDLRNIPALCDEIVLFIKETIY